MKFRFRHGALQSEQKSVIKVARIVESILIEDECLGESADFQETMPVSGVACQSRDLQTHYDPGFFQTHFRYQLLKSFAIRCRRRGLTQVAVDHNDLLDRPAQGYGALPKIILPYRALGVLKHLAQSGLPYIQISVSLQMAGIYFFMRGCGHDVASG